METEREGRCGGPKNVDRGKEGRRLHWRKRK